MKDYITPEQKEKYPNIPPEIWVPRVEDFSARATFPELQY
jgi:hypothetical protein